MNWFHRISQRDLGIAILFCFGLFAVLVLLSFVVGR